MESFVALSWPGLTPIAPPVPLPPDQEAIAGLRLALHSKVSQMFPGCRIKILLAGDGVMIEQMPVRFAACVFLEPGEVIKINALSVEGLISRLQDQSFKRQSNNGQAP